MRLTLLIIPRSVVIRNLLPSRDIFQYQKGNVLFAGTPFDFRERTMIQNIHERQKDRQVIFGQFFVRDYSGQHL